MIVRLLLVCTLGLVFWPLCLSLKDDVSINEISKEVSLHDEEERIVGGQNARHGELYWTGALYFEQQMICTCSILSPMTILTAAHCIINNNQQLPVAGLWVIVGNINSSSPVIRVNISSIIPHPDFEPNTLLNDVAVLKPLSPIPFSNHVGSICIAAGSRGPDQYKYKVATAMGWGSTSRGLIEGTVSAILQHVDLLILPIEKCEFRYHGLATHNNICGDGFGKGICQGDSGGPFVYKSKTSFRVQIGVASFISQKVGCGSFIIGPSAFAFVPSFAEWILSASNDREICTVP